MGKWDETEQAKKYRQNFRKINYDTLSVDLPKGLKKLFTDELKFEDKPTATFITEMIIKYLINRGYTFSQIENYIAESKKKAEI
jgi:SOS response regulatory protein OraA/RecX